MTATANRSSTIEIEHIDAPVGAIVHGDLSTDPSGEDIYKILQAFRERHVLVIKEQPLPDERLLEIAAWFGPQFTPPPNIPVLGDEEQGLVTRISNADDGVGARQELPFHTDLQFMPMPLKGALLHAITVPPQEAGGDTLWSNMHLALDELDPELRAKIEDVRGIGINPYAGGRRDAEEFTGSNQKFTQEPVPDFPHRLIRTHPETGRQSLYFSLFMWKLEGFEDRPDEEQEILNELRAYCDQDRFYYRHKWNAGDTLIWDNRCTNHKREHFDGDYLREMHRIQIAGTRPF